MTTHVRFALASALIAATTAASGCNQSISRLSIPSNVVWNKVITGFSSPYNDLSVVAHSNGHDSLIHATVGPNDFDAPDWIPYGYCSTPPPDTNHQGAFLVACPSADRAQCAPACASSGGTLNGIRYLGQLGIKIDRPAFKSGGIAVQSASHGTIYALTFSVNDSTNNVLMAGGVSKGVIPSRLKPPNSTQGALAADAYAFFDFLPHDPGFANAEYGVPVNPPFLPTVQCSTTLPNPNVPGDGGDDGILIRSDATTLGTYACGSINFNLSLSRHLDDMEDCVEEATKIHCKNQGLVGQAREVCNAEQVNLCKALFGHQNHADDSDGCHNGD